MPDSADTQPSTCYHISTLKATWTDANLECEKLNAKLVEPRTAIDLRKIASLISTRTSADQQQYWIGALQLMFDGLTVPVFKSDMQELPNAVSQQISQKRAAPLNRCLGLVQCSADVEGQQCDKSNGGGFVLASLACQQENLFVCQQNSQRS